MPQVTHLLHKAGIMLMIDLGTSRLTQHCTGLGTLWHGPQDGTGVPECCTLAFTHLFYGKAARYSACRDVV